MTGPRVVASIALLSATAASAQPLVVADSGDSAWVLAASALVLLAVAGVAGRAREASGALAAALIAWVVIGYSLAFAPGSAILGGTSNTFLSNFAELRADTTVSESTFALFQTALALLSVALVVSGVATRARSGWLLAFAPLWLLVVHAPVTRWIGSGWLADLGALDYGGGIAVLTSAGMAVLVLAALLGREEPAGHQSRTGLITAGWFGVAGGAALAAGDDAASAILTVLLSGAAGVLTLSLLERRYDAATTGGLAGLAAGTAAAGYAGPAGAMLLGVGGGIAAWGTTAMLTRLRGTDPNAAIACFGAGGLIGALLLPFTALPALGGPGINEGATLLSLLTAQAVAVLAVALWSAVATVILALMVSVVLPMRLRED